MNTANYSQKFSSPYRSRPTGEARRLAKRRRPGPSGRALYPEHLSDPQRAWLARFQQVTGQPILHLEALHVGAMSFNYVARVNIEHYEQRMREIINAITRDVPYSAA